MAGKYLTLGFRFSNKDFTYALMSGTKSIPCLVEEATIAFPKGYSRSNLLKWLLQEVETLLTRNRPTLVVVKRHEGRTKGLSHEERVECEATVYIAVANTGLGKVFKKVARTLAKDLGQKGKAKYLKVGLDTSVIVGYDDLTDKGRDAVNCAWSELA